MWTVSPPILNEWPCFLPLTALARRLQFQHFLASLEETYKVLEDTLRQHYQPTVVVIAERFHFHRRAQGSEESVAEFLAELRRLAMHCDFKTHLNEALRDKLVCGLHNSSIQKKLL